jgi:hypothetical protein
MATLDTVVVINVDDLIAGTTIRPTSLDPIDKYLNLLANNSPKNFTIVAVTLNKLIMKDPNNPKIKLFGFKTGILRFEGNSNVLKQEVIKSLIVNINSAKKKIIYEKTASISKPLVLSGIRDFESRHIAISGDEKDNIGKRMRTIYNGVITKIHYVLQPVKGDGNCFYRSLFGAAYHSPGRIYQEVMFALGIKDEDLLAITDKDTYEQKEDVGQFLIRQAIADYIKDEDVTYASKIQDSLKILESDTVVRNIALKEVTKEKADLFRSYLSSLKSKKPNITEQTFKDKLASIVRKDAQYADEVEYMLVKTKLNANGIEIYTKPENDFYEHATTPIFSDDGTIRENVFHLFLWYNKVNHYQYFKPDLTVVATPAAATAARFAAVARPVVAPVARPSTVAPPRPGAHGTTVASGASVNARTGAGALKTTNNESTASTSNNSNVSSMSNNPPEFDENTFEGEEEGEGEEGGKRANDSALPTKGPEVAPVSPTATTPVAVATAKPATSLRALRNAAEANVLNTGKTRIVSSSLLYPGTGLNAVLNKEGEGNDVKVKQRFRYTKNGVTYYGSFVPVSTRRRRASRRSRKTRRRSTRW